MLPSRLRLSALLIVLAMAALDARTPDLACRPNTCEIVLTRLVTLSDSGHTGALPINLPLVVQDRLGRFFVGSRRHNQVLVFDGAGKIRTTLGQDVAAGVHFRRIGTVLVGNDESVLVHDLILHKLTVFSSDFKVLREVPMSFAPSYVRDDGTFIVAEQIRTPDLVGNPIHHASANGRVLRSFGADEPEFRFDLRLTTDRLVARASDGTLWATARGRYVLDRWDPVSGTRRARLTIKSSWFTPSATPIRDERIRPQPIIEALWEQDGLVWTLLRDADSKWAPPLQANIERAYDLAEYNRTYDWVIEAVHPASGAVVAHRRFPTAHWSRSSSGLLVSRRLPTETPDVLDVWKVRLVRKER